MPAKARAATEPRSTERTSRRRRTIKGGTFLPPCRLNSKSDINFSMTQIGISPAGCPENGDVSLTPLFRVDEVFVRLALLAALTRRASKNLALTPLNSSGTGRVSETAAPHQCDKSHGDGSLLPAARINWN